MTHNAFDPQAFRAAREAKGMTIEQVGDLVGRCGATVAQWEMGRTKPHRRTFVQLAHALDLHDGYAV